MKMFGSIDHIDFVRGILLSINNTFIKLMTSSDMNITDMKTVAVVFQFQVWSIC